MFIDNISKNILDGKDLLDFSLIPQGSSALTTKPDQRYQSLNPSFSKYRTSFYDIWQKKIKDFVYILPSAEKIGKYGVNFRQHDQDYYQNLLDNSNMEQLASIDRQAIITSNSNLRSMPTLHPSYHHPLLAGEGCPFDNIQENLLRIGEPLLVSHYSRDQCLAFVMTNAKTYGFVAREDLAFIEQDLINTIVFSDHVMIIKDNTNIFYHNAYLTQLDLGAILPVIDRRIMLVIRTLTGIGQLVEVTLNQQDTLREALTINQENIKDCLEKFIGKTYGWGGYLRLRDCAQLVKDFYAMFGLHLPIFSKEQIKIGKNIVLDGMTKAEKIKIIKTLPPYFTLLYRKGHIVIYIGLYEEHMIIFHTVWGIKIYHQQTEYRYIIGKGVLSTLEYGREIDGFDLEKSDFLYNISHATILSPELF